MKTYYKPGCWNVVCDVCGFHFKSDQLMRRWDGLMVCKDDFETRHPSDLIRVPTDDSHVPWARPEPTDVFINFYLVTDTGDVFVTESGDTISYIP